MKQIDVTEELPCENQVIEFQPCIFCSRTFRPNILPRHTEICEKYAKKRRRVPFDSSRQRRKVTDFTSYLSRVNKNYDDVKKKPPNNWRAKHEELLRAIRVARGVKDEDIVLLSTKPDYSQKCPLCNRNFIPKSYERHFQFCKEIAQRRYRKEKSATNTSPVDKEDLETKIKYRVPLLPQCVATIAKRQFPRTSLNNGNAPIKATQPEKVFISTLSVEKVPAMVLSVQPDRESLRKLNGNERIYKLPQKPNFSENSSVKISISTNTLNQTKVKTKNSENNYIYDFNSMPKSHFELMIWKQTQYHSNVLNVSNIITDQLQTLNIIEQKDSVKPVYKLNEDIHLFKSNKSTNKQDNDNSDSEILKRLKEFSNPLACKVIPTNSNAKINILKQNKKNMNLNNLSNIFGTKNNGIKNLNTFDSNHPIFANTFSNSSTANNTKCANELINHDNMQLIDNNNSFVDEKKKCSLLKAEDFKLINPAPKIVSKNDIKCSESWNSIITDSINFQHENIRFTNLAFNYNGSTKDFDGSRNKQKNSYFNETENTQKLGQTTSKLKKKNSHHDKSVNTSSTGIYKKNNQNSFKTTILPVLRNVQYKNKSISNNCIRFETDALMVKQNNQTFCKDTYDRGIWTHSQDVSSITTNDLHFDTNLTKLKTKLTKTYKSKETGQEIKIPETVHLPYLKNMKNDRSSKYTRPIEEPLKFPFISFTRPLPTKN